MNDLKISELHPQNSSSIVPLVQQVQQIHVNEYSHVFRADIPEIELIKFLESWLSKDNVTALIASNSGQKPLGYLIFEIQKREMTTLKKPSRTCIIHHIAVDTSFRQKGVAKMLIEAMKQRIELLDVDSIAAEYYAFNQSSAALMRSIGLQISSIKVDSGPI